MARIGRPSSYTEKIAGEICRRIAEGESLVEICGPKRLRRLPHRQTVYVWLSERPDFQRAYRRAREIQPDRLFDEIVPIADGRDKAGGQARDISRDRLRVDARRYAAARLAPRRYGDKVTQAEEADADGEFSITETAAKIAAIFEEVRRQGGDES